VTTGQPYRRDEIRRVSLRCGVRGSLSLLHVHTVLLLVLAFALSLAFALVFRIWGATGSDSTSPVHAKDAVIMAATKDTVSMQASSQLRK
jgi:hypothetical protein